MTKICTFFAILISITFVATVPAKADATTDLVKEIVEDKQKTLNEKVDALLELPSLDESSVLNVAKIFVKVDKAEGFGRIGNALIRMIEATDNEAAFDIMREHLPQEQLHIRLRIAFFNAVANNDIREDIESYIVGLTASSVSSLRVLAVANCGENVYPTGYEKVRAALNDESWRVQVSAIDALGYYSYDPDFEDDATAAIINFMGRVEGRLIEDCARVLREMSGEDYGTDPEAWAAWFRQKKEDADVSVDGARKSRYRIETFDVNTYSKQLIFVIDSSDSMKEEVAQAVVEDRRRVITGANRDKDEKEGKEKGKKKKNDNKEEINWDTIRTKLDLAKVEFERTINGLPGDTMFTVVSYSTDVKAWKPKLVQATDANKASAIKYVMALKTNKLTNIYGALDYAINLAEQGYVDDGDDKGKKRVTTGRKETSVTDTIYFLSDGFATAGKYQGPKNVLGKATPEQATFYSDEMQAMIEEIEHRNQVAKIIIHTIGVGIEHDRWTLPDLSDATGGSYVAIGADEN